ncbi:hypothetical protein Tco_1351269 [Tanacetum coccineum]
MEDEFYHLTVKGNDLKANVRRFQELATLCPTMVPDSEKMMEVFVGSLCLMDLNHYPIWEVIQNGNGSVQVSTDTNRQIKVLPPKTAEEILAREREGKARTTLLMAYKKTI